jgi:two-component system invasion response regulator UvrY
MSTPTPGFPRGLLLVDDHTIVREGIKRILEQIAADWSVTEASCAFEALDCLRREPFALAIVDLSMPGMSGLELIRRIKTLSPSTAVLVLSMHAEEQYAMRAFKAGANGYLTKDSAAAELVHAVAKVAAGGAYVSPSMAERTVQLLSGALALPGHAELSDRELDVLKRIVAGQRVGEIAQALHLSVKTVSSHKARIQDKLALPSTAALVRYGIENGLDREDSTFDVLDRVAPHRSPWAGIAGKDDSAP